MKTIATVYKDHAEMPYLAPEYRDDLLAKPIAKRQMIRTEEGLLPGHIILLWRIQFGTYRTDTSHHKYFATTYGINAQKELEWLIQEGYVIVESATESIKHLSAPVLKGFLTEKAVKGLSKMKRQDIDQAIHDYLTEDELADLFDLRGYALLEKGHDILAKYPDIVAKHPQKKYK